MLSTTFRAVEGLWDSASDRKPARQAQRAGLMRTQGASSVASARVQIACRRTPPSPASLQIVPPSAPPRLCWAVSSAGCRARGRRCGI
eukprot:scaffold19017_cov69-Phaeocystis_antarctica.AAC.3